MAFNKNACKRLGVLVGIDRESREIHGVISDLVKDYLAEILYKVIKIVLFTGRKTLLPEDLKILSQIDPECTPIIYPNNLSKLTNTCTNSENLLAKKGYELYTLKSPFDQLVREILVSQGYHEIRISKDFMALLQSLTEHYVIEIMSKAFLQTNRDTLLSRDIEKICNI